MSDITVDEMGAGLPASYPVSVVMERRTSTSRWVEENWEAVGVLPGEGAADARTPLKIHDHNGIARYLHRGFRLYLHPDECESYYHNLMTSRPRCYVVARSDEDEIPVPMLVSLSFDEAHAYLEAGNPIYAVDIPAQLYRWCEAYVLAHYVPERKVKRKLTHWKDEARRRP